MGDTLGTWCLFGHLLTKAAPFLQESSTMGCCCSRKTQPWQCVSGCGEGEGDTRKRRRSRGDQSSPMPQFPHQLLPSWTQGSLTPSQRLLQAVVPVPRAWQVVSSTVKVSSCGCCRSRGCQKGEGHLRDPQHHCPSPEMGWIQPQNQPDPAQRGARSNLQMGHAQLQAG